MSLEKICFKFAFIIHKKMYFKLKPSIIVESIKVWDLVKCVSSEFLKNVQQLREIRATKRVT